MTPTPLDIHESVVVSVSRAELEAMIERAVVNGMADAGLYLEEPADRRDAREDFRFLRRTRLAMDGAAAKVGYIVLGTITSAFLFLIWRRRD